MNKELPYKEALKEYGETTKLKRAYSYKALNRLIQASAADMTKQSMVNLYKERIIPLIQIHDEIAVSVKDKNTAKDIAKIMENAVLLEVPNNCDVEIGPSWGEAKALYVSFEYSSPLMAPLNQKRGFFLDILYKLLYFLRQLYRRYVWIQPNGRVF